MRSRVAGKRRSSPGADERVLERALLHPVVPLAAVEGVRGRLDERPVVVALAGGARAALAHEVDLAGADHDVVADAAAQHLGRPPAVRPVVGGEVDRRVEAASREQALEVGGRAVAAEALDAVAERVGERAAVEERDRVPGRDQPQRELVAEEAVAADDERPSTTSLQGSVSFSTFAVCSSRKARSFSRSGGRAPARMATARRAAFVAPGLPMASVPTGMPAGICTVASSESRPLSEALSIGTPEHGQEGVRGHDAGQVRGAAGGGDQHLDAARLGRAHVLDGGARRAVRREHAALVGDAEARERLARALHRLPVRLAAHQDAHEGLVVGHRSDPRLARHRPAARLARCAALRPRAQRFGTKPLSIFA